MGNGIFGVGVSALNVAQIGLATTQHNIANANTPGFNRQQVDVGARMPQGGGAGFVGQGADVVTIKRAYSELLSGQVLSGQGQSSHLNTYYAQIQQINNMLADPNAGLSPAIQEFFTAVNGVSNSPESMPARQAMVSSAQFLTSQFQSLNQRMTDINNGVNSQITASVTNINSYATQIAALNQNIVLAQGAANGQPPNDLLDQRDQLISQLNLEIKATVTKQVDGSYNVNVGNGQSLVVGTQAFTLQTAQSQSDPNKLEVAYRNWNGSTILLQQSSLQGGQLGGLMDFRTNTLDTAQNALGRVAMVVAGTFNAQHQLGQDLNGVLGGSFFTQPLPLVSTSTLNAGTGVASASIANYSALTGSDYTLTFNGATGYALRRMSDNTVTTYATLPQTVDGLTISLVGAPVAGDSFTIRPTVNGARDIAVAFSDPAKIAAAAPVRTNAPLTNTGTGRISAGAVDATFAAATITPAVTLTYNAGAPATLTGFPALLPVTVTNNGVAVAYAAGAPVNYTAGATVSFGGISFTLTGTPNAGDTFTVGPNIGATKDNRNALLLAGLQTKNTMTGGTITYQGAYSQLVSQIGNKTRELEVTSLAQTNMVNLSIQAQQSVSGVNLDEEAANLMRYQRMYQAASKAIQIANTMFDAIVSLR